MVARTSAALLLTLSLVAPPLVGIVCGFVCETDHQPGATEAAPWHHHHDAAGGQHGEVAPVQIAGQHICDHGLGIVDLYSPSTQMRPVLLGVVSLAPPPAGLGHAVTAPWGQPLERVLGPPTRSPVLRI